jgi:hypothetical protein
MEVNSLTMSLCEVLKIPLNFVARGEEMRPIPLGVPGKNIVVGRDITCDSRICVLVPSASELRVLLKQSQIPRSRYHHLFHLIRKAESRCSSTNASYPQLVGLGVVLVEDSVLAFGSRLWIVKFPRYAIGTSCGARHC